MSQFLDELCYVKDVKPVRDFNLPSLHWNGMGELFDGFVSPLDQPFFEVFLESVLTQLVCNPTYIPPGNILDLILIS